MTATRCFWSATSSTAGSSSAAGTGPKRRAAWWREILRKVDDGTRVIFVPGNHDEFAARLLRAALFAGIEVVRETIHETADGKRLLVLHGDRSTA